MSIEERTVFQQYWLILNRRWLIGSAVFVVLLAILLLVASSRRSSYKAEGILKF